MIHDGQMENILSMMGAQGVRRKWSGTNSVDVGVPTAPVLSHQDRHACGFPRVARLVVLHVIPMPLFLGTKTFVATA